MDKFEIRKTSGKFALYKGNCSIGMITITRILYGKFSMERKEEYRRFMRKFGIRHMTKIVADDKEIIETFLRFLESRYLNE